MAASPAMPADCLASVTCWPWNACCHRPPRPPSTCSPPRRPHERGPPRRTARAGRHLGRLLPVPAHRRRGVRSGAVGLRAHGGRCVDAAAPDRVAWRVAGASPALAVLGDRPGKWRLVGLGIGFAGVAWLAGSKASLRPGEHGISPALAIAACLLAT